MNRKITYTILLASILGIVFLSCKKKEYSPLYMGYDYFPNKVGHYVIYECDSMVHLGSGFGNLDYKYQIKEVIDSIYNNNQGQPTMRIVRYKRTDTSIPWSNFLTPQKIWTATLLSSMAIRLEDNYNYVKLVFPMSANETWGGNNLNTLGGDNYQYTSLNTPYTLTTVNSNKQIHFDSTLTVMEINKSNLLEANYAFEQYAPGVGMIHRVVNADTSSAFPPPGYSSPDTSLPTTWGIWYSETFISSGNQ